MIQALGCSAEAEKSFYPTPQPIIDELLSGIDWAQVGAVLEPSAGKGDIANAISQKLNMYMRRKTMDEFDIDCVEIDPDLRYILSGKGFRVVHDDFMTLRTFKRYSAIIMNPPFSHGTEHLLKALEMQSRGGYIACILNSETLENPYTNARKRLVGILAQHEASIVYKDSAFVGAERSTGVRIAIVKVSIPYEQERESAILDGLRADVKRRKEFEPQVRNELAKGDFIDAIVDRFNFELEAGCRLIREYNAMLPYLMDGVSESSHKSPMLSLIMGSIFARTNQEASENELVRMVRKKYWSALFTNEQFVATLTSNMRKELLESVEKLCGYDFSSFNIAAIRLNMQKGLIDGLHRTIMALFDDWTRKFHWDEASSNKHYFDGWRTNDAFAVNKRVIIPRYLEAFDQWNGKFKPTGYATMEALYDTEKVFDFLSGNTPDKNGVREKLESAEKSGQNRGIPLRYFKVTFFKKGTCHIEFTDLDVLHKFNLYAARDKKWLPPSYGRKAYNEMDTEERNVVDTFEGKESYEMVMRRADYFLASPSEQNAAFLLGGQSSEEVKP